MGYRLHINFDESNLPEVLPIDGKYKAIIKIENTGVSRILNEKKTKILLRGSQDYEFELFDDLRKVNSLSFYNKLKSLKVAQVKDDMDDDEDDGWDSVCDVV